MDRPCNPTSNQGDTSPLICTSNKCNPSGDSNSFHSPGSALPPFSLHSSAYSQQNILPPSPGFVPNALVPSLSNDLNLTTGHLGVSFNAFTPPNNGDVSYIDQVTAGNVNNPYYQASLPNPQPHSSQIQPALPYQPVLEQQFSGMALENEMAFGQGGFTGSNEVPNANSSSLPTSDPHEYVPQHHQQQQMLLMQQHAYQQQLLSQQLAALGQQHLDLSFSQAPSSSSGVSAHSVAQTTSAMSGSGVKQPKVSKVMPKRGNLMIDEDTSISAHIQPAKRRGRPSLATGEDAVLEFQQQNQLYSDGEGGSKNGQSGQHGKLQKRQNGQNNQNSRITQSDSQSDLDSDGDDEEETPRTRRASTRVKVQAKATKKAPAATKEKKGAQKTEKIENNSQGGKNAHSAQNVQSSEDEDEDDESGLQSGSKVKLSKAEQARIDRLAKKAERARVLRRSRLDRLEVLEKENQIQRTQLIEYELIISNQKRFLAQYQYRVQFQEELITHFRAKYGDVSEEIKRAIIDCLDSDATLLATSSNVFGLAPEIPGQGDNDNGTEEQQNGGQNEHGFTQGQNDHQNGQNGHHFDYQSVSPTTSMDIQQPSLPNSPDRSTLMHDAPVSPDPANAMAGMAVPAFNLALSHSQNPQQNHQNHQNQHHFTQHPTTTTTTTTTPTPTPTPNSVVAAANQDTMHVLRHSLNPTGLDLSSVSNLNINNINVGALSLLNSNPLLPSRPIASPGGSGPGSGPITSTSTSLTAAPSSAQLQAHSAVRQASGKAPHLKCPAGDNITISADIDMLHILREQLTGTAQGLLGAIAIINDGITKQTMGKHLEMLHQIALDEEQLKMEQSKLVQIKEEEGIKTGRKK